MAGARRDGGCIPEPPKALYDSSLSEPQRRRAMFDWLKHLFYRPPPPARRDAIRPCIPPIAAEAIDAIVVDIETTGLAHYDRIISLAAVPIRGEVMGPEAYYLVFDPRRDSAPAAAAIHGWDDWTLRFQDLFSDHAEDVHKLLSSASILVAHNAEFDLSFIDRELRHAGVSPLNNRLFCTMLHAREKWPGHSAKLDACLAQIGLARDGRRHDAFEDAWLTGNLYRYFLGAERPYRLPSPLPLPTNLHLAPPRPLGPLPRRTPKPPGRPTHRDDGSP
jgi:DNA polymerase-3 subunit epsilon